MRTAFIFLMITLGGYYLSRDSAPSVEYIGDRLASDNTVIMYSLTTCPRCKRMAANFHEAGIPFREVFLDKDEKENRRFWRMLRENGVKANGTIGTPTLVVNDTLLLNSPAYETVVAELRMKPD